MATYYHVCGSKITYEATLPKACPKCGGLLSDPTKVVAAAMAAATKVAAKLPVSAAKVEASTTEDDSTPVRPVARSAKSKPIVRKPATRRLLTANLEDDEPEDDPEMEGADQTGDNEEEDDGQPLNRKEARRLARELAASIDPSTIHVGDADERPVTFADWCARGPKGEVRS